jgi:ribonucleoside-diphosphate reductase alpha subunit
LDNYKFNESNDYHIVHNIKYYGKENVYDLSLENGHNFIANCVVVHNCTLSSISLQRFVEGNNTYNYKKLEEVVRIAITNLNKIIDINFYPVPETEFSNKKHRPLGLGVQGLQDVFFLMRAPFDSERARELNKKIFETIYYAAVKTSCEISKIEGPYETFYGSPISKGLFQFDLWNVTPSDRYDWNSLRKDVMKYGVRNSLLIALMPTASTAQILGSTECFEPITSNIYTRRTIAGDFIMINKYLIDDLINLELWNKDMKDMIIASNGSIQNIDGIPIELKNLYKTAWELPQKSIIQLAIDRGCYVCQTQSMNLFFEEPTQNILHSAFMFAWKNGLKTGSYYIRSRPKVKTQQFTIDPEKLKKIKDSKNAQKIMCSLENPASCVMCSG